MEEKLRKSGIDIIGDVQWGTHFCQFYQTRADLIDILVPYFKAGLENNELCVWITSKPLEVKEAKKALKLAVPDIDVYLEKGQIEIIPYTHGYLKNGIFDPDRVVNSWVEKINQTLERGYDGLRAAGDNQTLERGYDGLRAAGDNRWLEKEGWNEFVDYENKVDAIIDKHHVIALCPYYLDMCSTAEIIDVVSNHQFALIKREEKWERIENSGRKRAEKEAIQAAKNWKYTFDAVPDLIAIIDDKYRVVRANRSMAARLGVTPEECAGLTCHRVIHGTEHSLSFCPHEQLLKDGAEHRAEVFEDCLGGYFSVSTSPLRDSEGKLIGNVYVAHDINERKQEEHRIRRYNRILERINRIFGSVVQAKTEEEMGNACLSVALEVTGSQFGFINEMGADGLLHDIAKSELAWEQCLMYDRTGHRRPPSDFAVHGLYGSVINNEKGFFTNNPLSHPDSIGLPYGHPPITSFLGVPLIQGGKTIGLIAVANREDGYSFEQQEDLEAIAPAVIQALQRKRSEEALRLSNLYNRSLIEASLDPLVTIRPDGKIADVNGATETVTGCSRNELIGTDFSNYFTEPEEARKGYQQVFIYGEIRDYPLEIKHKDGHITPVLYNASVYRDGNGEVIGVFAAARDITERKRVEEALQKSEAELARAQQISQIGSWTWDLTNNEVTWSEQSYRNYGLAPGEVKPSYELFLSFIVPEDRERVDREVQKAIESSHKYNITYNIVRIDGMSRILLSENEIITDESGKIVLMYGTNQDITERKKAEEALKKAHDNLEKLVEERTTQLEKAYNSLKISEKGLAEAQKMAHIGNWEWDLVTGESYWSEEMYHIFGRNFKESGLTYDELLSYMHPDDRDYVGNAIKKALNEKPFGIDYRIIITNGEERTVHAQSEVIFDEKNIPIRAKGIVQDITARKRAEERIQTLANAVESSNDAIVTLSLDGIITSWNKAAEQTYGYLAEELLGKDVSILEPESLKGEIKQFSEKIKQGKKVQHYETSRLRKDGTIINISVSLSPIFDITGKLVAISGIVRDVTERIKAEKALRESEARLRQLYESDMIGVFYYNLDGSITDANDKLLEIVGYTREDLQAGEVNWNRITPPEYSFLDEQCITELKITDVKEPKEKEYIRKDGSHIPVIVGSATFDKVCNEGIAFVLDITEKKKAEEALANVEITRKKEIHHRIKNNLQVISSLLDLQADKFDNSKVIEAFRESQNRVISMALIHEELYKGEGTDTLDFCEYIQELAENLFQTYSLCSKKIHLNMNLEEYAFFDMDVAVPLGIIVNELVSNSLKHAFPDRKKGEIRIKLIRDEKEGCIKSMTEDCKSTSFTLTVSDDGIGIPENLDIEDLDSLGFQLVTSLVDQLDGELELKRNNGTEFTMRFTVTEKDNLAQAGLKSQENG